MRAPGRSPACGAAASTSHSHSEREPSRTAGPLREKTTAKVTSGVHSDWRSRERLGVVLMSP